MNLIILALSLTAFLSKQYGPWPINTFQVIAGLNSTPFSGYIIVSVVDPKGIQTYYLFAYSLS